MPLANGIKREAIVLADDFSVNGLNLSRICRNSRFQKLEPLDCLFYRLSANRISLPFREYFVASAPQHLRPLISDNRLSETNNVLIVLV